VSAVILDRGMAESGLHHLERQFEAAVGAAVDAPRGMEVPQRMQAAVFRAAVPIDDASGNLRRVESALDDTVPVIDAALAVGEGEAEFAVGTSEAVLAQHRQDHRRNELAVLRSKGEVPPWRHSLWKSICFSMCHGNALW